MIIFKQLRELLLLAVTSQVSSQISYSLFDLELDPVESTNVYGDVSYSAIQSELQDRLDYFIHNVSVSQMLASIPNDFSVHIAAGGEVPFLGDYQNPPEIPTIPANPPAPSSPSIVFILMDDVGYNDVGFQTGNSTWLDFSTPNMDGLAEHGIRLTNHYTGYAH